MRIAWWSSTTVSSPRWAPTKPSWPARTASTAASPPSSPSTPSPPASSAFLDPGVQPMPPDASLRVFAMYAAGVAGGLPSVDHAESHSPGPLWPATRSWFSASKNLPRRYGSTEGSPPCHTRLTPARITETSKAFEGSRRQGGHYSTSKHESSDTGGGRGWGEVPSRDPYLLGR